MPNTSNPQKQNQEAIVPNNNKIDPNKETKTAKSSELLKNPYVILELNKINQQKVGKGLLETIKLKSLNQELDSVLERLGPDFPKNFKKPTEEIDLEDTIEGAESILQAKETDVDQVIDSLIPKLKNLPKGLMEEMRGIMKKRNKILAEATLGDNGIMVFDQVANAALRAEEDSLMDKYYKDYATANMPTNETFDIVEILKHFPTPKIK